MINFGKSSEPLIDMLAFFNHNNMGTILLDWDIYKNSILNFKNAKYNVAIKRMKTTMTDSLISSELKMLKENYHSQAEYDWEDETYVEFKRLNTKQIRSIYPKRWILSLLGHIGKYGTDPWSVFFSMIIAVLLFALLYSTPYASIYPDNVSRHWWSPVYYSLITFLTIGYGDLSAQNGFTAVICGIEGFFGVFMMSYFSVAVVRKILR